MKKKSLLALIFLAALLILAVPVFAQGEARTGIVSGRIVNLSPDGTVPEELDLMLHAWDENINEKFMLNGTSKADGTFEFDEVTLDPTLLYAVMLTYDEAVYASEPAQVTEGQTALTLEIPIYDSTADTSAVRIDRQHILFDAAPNSLRVAEIYIVSNTGTRTVVGRATEEDGLISALQFPLPEGATDISFNERNGADRFLLTPGGFVDTAPLLPGEGTGQIVVSYALPYEDGLPFSWISQWPTDNLTFMVATGIGLSLEGEHLSPAGARDLGEGRQVDVFEYGSLGPGERAAVSLSGDLELPLAAPAGSMAPEAETRSDALPTKTLALVGVALGLVLMIVGVWWYRRSDSEEAQEPQDLPEADYDQLVTRIALLDEAHDRGEINGSDYVRKRAQMVGQATVLIARESEEDVASPSPSY